MKRAWLIWLFVLLLLTVTAASASAQTPTPPSPQPTPAPKGIGETLVDNLPGILTGIAGILTAIFTFLQSRSKQQKLERDLGEKTTSADVPEAVTAAVKEMPQFRHQLLVGLLDQNTIQVIENQGHFVTEAKLNKRFERHLRDALDRQSMKQIIRQKVLSGEEARQFLIEALMLSILLEPQNRENLRRALLDESEVTLLMYKSLDEKKAFVETVFGHISKLKDE